MHLFFFFQFQTIPNAFIFSSISNNPKCTFFKISHNSKCIYSLFFNFKQFQMHLFFFLNFKQSSYYSSIPDCDPEICISQKHNKIHNKCIWGSVQKPKWETKSILSIKESYSMKKVSLTVNFPLWFLDTSL